MIRTSVEQEAETWRTEDESDRYSRHSWTLAPRAALVVWFDVRLHPVLHHAAHGACHHIRTPVPEKSHTQAKEMTNE